eukprot:501852_1
MGASWVLCSCILMAVPIGWYAIICGNCRTDDYNNSDWRKGFEYGAICCGVGAVLTYLLFCVGFSMLGFRSSGISSRSFAASWQSRIGNVRGNSFFSYLQPIIMKFINGLPYMFIGIIGALISKELFLKLNELQMCC